MPNRPIFLLTDFGSESLYPGAMKAVIVERAPEARIFDICHGIAPQAVMEAALAVEAIFDILPKDAILVAIVDPGVGSDRVCLAARVYGKTLLTPDNGTVTTLLGRDHLEMNVIDRPDLERSPRSHTFHGRDLFAPVAAHLSRGGRERELGPRLSEAQKLSDFEATKSGDAWEGKVVAIDHFGNLITNIRTPAILELGEKVTIFVESIAISGFSKTYSSVAIGQTLAYGGSGGRLEIGVRNARADVDLKAPVGTRVRVVAGAMSP